MRPGVGEPTRLVAADGCRAGWIAVIAEVHPDGTFGGLDARLLPDAGALVAFAADAGVIAVDIPIGLPGAEPRACDVAARGRLGPRRSSVFPAPPRAARDATTHAEANAIARRVQGRGMSLQAFHLLPKIRDVDRMLLRRPNLAARVFEVHPEASFAAWNGAPLAHAKRRPEGLRERREQVRAVFGLEVVEAVLARERRRDVAEDDVLDALAVLWTAGRIARDVHETLPGPHPPRDAEGLPMRIVV